MAPQEGLDTVLVLVVDKTSRSKEELQAIRQEARRLTAILSKTTD